jgi:hypothetical protein
MQELTLPFRKKQKFTDYYWSNRGLAVSYLVRGPLCCDALCTLFLEFHNLYKLRCLDPMAAVYNQQREARKSVKKREDRICANIAQRQKTDDVFANWGK